MGDCKWGTDEIIELHAMDRIEDGFVRELDYCNSCTTRVGAVRLLQETSVEHQEEYDDDSNRQDES